MYICSDSLSSDVVRTNMRQPDVTYEAVLVAELLVAERALEGAVGAGLGRRLGDERDLVRRQLRRRRWWWSWWCGHFGRSDMPGCEL